MAIMQEPHGKLLQLQQFEDHNCSLLHDQSESLPHQTICDQIEAKNEVKKQTREAQTEFDKFVISPSSTPEGWSGYCERKGCIKLALHTSNCRAWIPPSQG
jgi:hypothetical protein